ncbi:MAG TPA: hypothetical protein VEM59_01630 [Acidimicrobiia bacterium]|nr:hypothetical protein [Acidimicrobiia bacterium]
MDATWRDLAQCLLTAGLIGTLAALDIYANVTAAHPFGSPFDAPALRDFFVSLGTYIAAVFTLPIVMVPMGIFLSIYWRRSGNLAVPGFTHAFSDAVRNVLVGVP